MIVMGIAMLIETPVLHFILLLWSSTVAWVVTISTLFFLIYMIWDYYAYLRCPMTIDESYFSFHLGSKISAKIKLTEIREIRNTTILSDKEQESYLILTPLSEFNTLIHFHTPQQFKTLFGKIHISDKILIFVDDAMRFKEKLRQAKGE